MTKLVSAAILAAVVSFPISTQDKTPARFSANAINLDPSVRLSATTVAITVDRWSTDAERERLLAILVENGQDKLVKALRDIPRVGTFKTPDSLSYDLHYARRTPAADGSERVVLVTDRYISAWEASTSSRSVQYPFTVIELRLDATGHGEGKISVATSISTEMAEDGKTRQIVLENYGQQPVRLTEVKRDSK